MFSNLVLALGGYGLLVLGTFGNALAGRYFRIPHRQESEDFIGVSLVCFVLTTLVGSGLIAVVHFAFTYTTPVGIGIVLLSLAATVAVQVGFWRLLGVHKLGLVKRRGTDAIAANDGWTPPTPPSAGVPENRRAA